jgi:hypothetical protein
MKARMLELASGLGVSIAIALFSTGCASTGGTASKRTMLFATVTDIQGMPQWSHGENVWKALPLHARIHQGDHLQTNAKSSATLDFGKYGGILRVPEGTEIVVEEFGPSFEPIGDTVVVIRVLTGHVSGNTLTLPETTKFYIQTQMGKMQIK